MKRPLTFRQALLPLLTMVACFAVGGIGPGFGSELLVVAMLAAAVVAGVLAIRAGSNWEEIQRSTGEKIASVLPAILILLSIGMLIGCWVLSGTIPMLIYYGLQLVSPKYLVVTAFLSTAAMSLCTGTSWGSAGTIGIALMGMAHAVGAPLAATAGAVVSGAYFGDKLSPLSDSTNLCAIGAGANLYAHIRNMLYTAVPSFVVALVVYLAASRLAGVHDGGLPPEAVRLMAEMDHVYRFNLWVLLPLALVIVGTLRKYPPVLVMAASSAVAMVVGVVVQKFGVSAALSAAVNGFDVSMIEHGAAPDNMSQIAQTLLNRGGLYSMTDTLLVIICAFLLAAGLDVSGGLDALLQRLLRAVNSVFGLIAATMAAGAAMISLTSHGGVTALIVGGLFQNAYRSMRLAPQNLSRSLEDSVTIVEPLLPWTVSALYMAKTVGVPTLDYVPWAVFCYGGPIFSLLYAAMFRRTGFAIPRLVPAPDPQMAEDSTRPRH